jgi:tetratricopeptide (TPR) repeat protein
VIAGLSNHRFAWLALAALAFAGCDQFTQKRTKDDLAAGDRKAAAGDFRGAVAAYEAAFDGTARTADAHFKLGLLYDDKLKQPDDAVHHLRRYLELDPKGARVKEAKAVLREAEQRVALARGGSNVTQAEAARLKNEIFRLNQDLAELRARRAATPAPADKNNEVARRPIPPGSRTHIVQPGETMAAIARKYYKNAERWRDIQDANFYATGGKPQKIKPGQTLIIPK